MKAITICFLSLFLLPQLAGQREQRELIVRWESARAGANVSVPDTEVRRWLSEPLGIELLRFRKAEQRAAARKLLSALSTVVATEPNRVLSLRAEPNDPDFSQQRENFARAGYLDAWNLTPGGKTTDNEQIVIALLDAGFELDHSDLAPNLWVNPGEVPNDGIDNDGNGYVDDLHGWDMVGNDAELPSNAHGTQVAGLVGARGDNGIGIAGTNWDTRLMLFSIRTTASVIEAYEYIRDQRRRYNESGGQSGTLVVATNASFGVEGATCAEFPVWASLYDALGQQGILTAASTANRNWDVELNGDMPTDCPSDYLIGVANLGENDLLFRSSAYGRLSVDLAAPGEGSFSTRPGNGYGPFGSTSAAAPYVTGAIALLYATPCDFLRERTLSDPTGTALLVRNAILDGATPNPSLLNRTVTGGLINVAEAQRNLLNSCNAGDPVSFAVTATRPSPAHDVVVVETSALVFSSGGRAQLFDATGRLVLDQPAVPVSFNPIELRVDVSSLPPGVYLLRITERDRVADRKIIVH